MATIGKRYAKAHPEQLGDDVKVGAIPTQQYMTGDVRPALLILLGAVGLVLLIACANVANLLLARVLARQGEIAIRAAIGAGRARILRQLLADSILLALAGGAAGLAVGSTGVRALLAHVAGDLPRAQELAHLPKLDPWVAGFTVLVSVVSGVAFGLFPALQLSRPNLVASLKESGSGTGTGLRHNRARGAFVVAETAMVVILLCGAMSLMRSFVAMHKVQLGFDPQSLWGSSASSNTTGAVSRMSRALTMKVALAGPEDAQASSVDRLSRQTVDRLERIPGVEAAAVATSLPTQPNVDMIFQIPGRPLLEGHKFTGDILWYFVSWKYFETLRIPLRSGRSFREPEPVQTVIINEAMARKFWPEQNPVGQSIVIGAGLGEFDEGPTEIVGLVGDVHDRLVPPLRRRCTGFGRRFRTPPSY